MKESFLVLLTFFYALTGIINLIAYTPTILDLWKGKSSANTTSFLIWTFAASIAFCYAMFILPDPLFQIVAGINLVCCLLITVLSLRLNNVKKN